MVILFWEHGCSRCKFSKKIANLCYVGNGASNLGHGEVLECEGPEVQVAHGRLEGHDIHCGARPILLAYFILNKYTVSKLFSFFGIKYIQHVVY
jgi:hypothetical protein